MKGKTGTRLKKIKTAASLLLVLIGLAMTAIAFFAYELKLDNNPQMGAQRKMLAILGIICLFLAVSLMVSKRIRRLGKTKLAQQVSKGYQQLRGRVCQSPIFLWIRKQGRRINHSKAGKWTAAHPGIWAFIGAFLVILVSYWYITAGLWRWNPYSHYFDRQADAFLNGSLALSEKPSQELLALADPYDYHNREGLSYIWDASLYQGRFYLYWGPVPAIIAAVVKLFHAGVVEDQYLLMFFNAGMIIALAALLHWLRKTLFPDTPAWTLLLLILAAGLSTPVLWLINRPSVYETAIAGGEFFLITGLYAALRSMTARRPNWWLVAAGVAWGATVGCRVNNAIAVVWLAGLTGIFYLIRERKTRNWLVPMICLGVPLLGWAVGLGWYNLARFGSVFETGHRYQLTGPALPADYSLVISAQYILPNLYNYLFRPLVFSWKQFPFVFTPFIKEQMWPWFIKLPQYFYYSEPVAGLFQSIPLFILVALPVLKPLQNAWRWVKEQPKRSSKPANSLLPWCWWMVGGAVLCNTGSLLLFISSTMRYLADVVPMMTILTGLSIWWGLGFFRQHPGYRRLLLILVVALGLVSICIGLLVNFQVGDQRFELNNPQLYGAIARFLTGK